MAELLKTALAPENRRRALLAWRDWWIKPLG
jgi:hypothetical protein